MRKYPGITHVSFKVGSIDAARQFLAGNDIPLSGQFLVSRICGRSSSATPTANVIELDAYVGEETGGPGAAAPIRPAITPHP